MEFFAELSYYSKEGGQYVNLHNNQPVKLGQDYVDNYLISASNFKKTEIVGKEDKLWTDKQILEAKNKGVDVSKINVGDVRVKGMKTIWNEIGAMPFTVTFQKVGKKLSDTAYNKQNDVLATEMVEKLEAAKASKKGVKNAAVDFLSHLLANPPSRFEQGEMRTLVGIKLQFSSEDGFYAVRDFEAKDGHPRSVNINTISELIYMGVKYVIEK